MVAVGGRGPARTSALHRGQRYASGLKVYDEIREQSSVLEAYPFIGRSGRVAGTRELVVTRTPYIIAYRVSSEGVDVLRVLHGARKWPTRF